MTRFATLEDALQVADRLGFHMRDAGLLASALARPATSLFGNDAYLRLEDKAAALLESVIRNHPFIDGNKRSGWTLMVTFLWLNGRRHEFTVGEAFDLVIGVAEGKLDLAAAADRLTLRIIER